MREITKRIRRKLYKKEAASMFFKDKEQDGTLTNRQKNIIKNIARYIKNISTHRKNYGKHLGKKQKSQYGLDYLFNEGNKKPINKFKMLEIFLMNVEVVFHLEK